MQSSYRPATIASVWDDPERPWPSIFYVATTNHCNARCLSCLNHRCQTQRGTMSLDVFRAIADKIKARGKKIGAMFCFGEPLLDPTLFEKFSYARSIGVLDAYISLNTNVSLLTPEKYDALLWHTDNVTLSFFNAGAEYERLTGLDWETSYRNALGFIQYRDQNRPSYAISIGVNKVRGHDLEAVERAFAGKQVVFVQDVEIRWGGKVMTGVLDRITYYSQFLLDFRCDGMKGAVQVKWDGSCEYCAFDVLGTPQGGETVFGSLLTDSWEALEANFRRTWRDGSSLCRRCEYWHLFSTFILDNRRPDPLPSWWHDWQKPYLGLTQQEWMMQL